MDYLESNKADFTISSPEGLEENVANSTSRLVMSLNGLTARLALMLMCITGNMATKADCGKCAFTLRSSIPTHIIGG